MGPVGAFDALMAQRDFEAANKLAMAVAESVLSEDASRWREELWRHFFSNLDKDYRAQYQSYDFETCDYELFAIDRGEQLFRGPAPSLIQILGGECITIFGAAQLFGRFQRQPFHKFISSETGVPILNLSMGGAGPQFFLQNRFLLPAKLSRCVVLQVLSGRSVGCEEYPGGRMTARAGTDDPIRDRIEILTEIWTRDRDYCRTLVRRWQSNYVILMKKLIRELRLPVILIWMSDRRPSDWSDLQLDEAPNFGTFPQLVDQEIVDEIKGGAAIYMELSPDEALEHGFTNRFTGEPCPVFEPDGSLRWANHYYASGIAHEELGREFMKHWSVVESWH